MIKDSGNRREFETGAVRDIQEGKGRCDLLPIAQIANLLEDEIIAGIALFLENRDINYIYVTVQTFAKEHYNGSLADAILDVSKHYEEGALKYGERNWEKGIPAHCYVDSGLRHYLKCLRGDTDERHDRAFIWNMLGLLWTLDNKPELDDLYYTVNKDGITTDNK